MSSTEGDEMPTTTGFPYRNNSRYHLYRARDPQARANHTAVSHRWRRALAEAAFNADDRHVLLPCVRSGCSVAEAAIALNLTHQQGYGRAFQDPELATELDETLARSYPAGPYCGTPSGARPHRGRCRACRRVRRATTRT